MNIKMSLEAFVYLLLIQINLTSSLFTAWEVSDYDIKITKGLHFYGRLTLSTKETYQATVNLLDGMQLETRLELPPLLFGKKMVDKDGNPNFRYVNLFMYNSADNKESGPTLVIGGNFARIEGYVSLPGVASIGFKTLKSWGKIL